MKEKRKIVFYAWFESMGTSEGEYQRIILYDSIKTGRAKYYNLARSFRNNKVLNFYKKVCKRNVYLSSVIMDVIMLKNNIKCCDIACFNEFHPFLGNGYVKRLRDRYGIKTVLVIENKFPNKLYPCVRSGVSLQKLKEEFDLIITDEEEDAQRFNLVYVPDAFCNPFSGRGMKKKQQWDLLFIGSDQQREGILRKIAKAAIKNNIKAKIMITGGKRNTSLIKYIDFLDYTDVLKEDVRANCILEVLQPGQTSYTLRYQEAIVLGKKLLTNNKSVLSEKYYDEKYIQLFDDIDKIDWEFVRKRENVDYLYGGDFSSEQFFDRIEENLERIRND